MHTRGSTKIVLPALLYLVVSVSLCSATEPPIQVSGVYPHLTMFNNENECGTGAVVPWAGKLWAITYAPHMPNGSSDKLYEISPELKQTIRPESIGGTPANRMIHKESNQLFIGPYAISDDGNVRVISVKEMPGRHTGNARHLTDPTNKIYYATMEEGLYSVDVKTLSVEEFIVDGHFKQPLQSGTLSQLPGYHGKGLYSGQDRVVYANNGEKSDAAKRTPTIPSGALAQWFGEGDWQLVCRNQFTELTGPGGIYGSDNPETDPIWAMGWDARSLLLGLLEDGEWSFYRLPKGSHSYDGAHGWNTEWPRIREIGETDLLATMHGTFWRFPATFSKANSAGIAPRSNYLPASADNAAPADNLVAGAIVTASSTLATDYAAANVVDGQRSDDSRWISGKSGDKWIKIDMGERKQFCCVSVVSGWKNDAKFVVKNIAVQTMVGGEWKTLPGGDIRDNHNVELAINFSLPITAQKVRLYSTDQDFVRLYEVALYNKPFTFASPVVDRPRVCREVATERDLLNLHGTFYELPARNAQGLAKIRPVATHNLAVHDFCSHNGLLFFTGLDVDANGQHIFRSDDGKAAVWAGVVDDLWRLGKPRGRGGPWKDSAVKAGVASDPYIMTAYDEKSVELSATGAAKITLEIDIDGTGLWVAYKTFDVDSDETVTHEFPDGFSAYWVRAMSDSDTIASVQFMYR